MNPPDQNFLVVCEPEDRWTKLIRRAVTQDDSFRVIRIPGHPFLKSWLGKRTSNFVALAIDLRNVEPVSELVREFANGAKMHRFVGLCRSLQPTDGPLIRGNGLDACYFSLTDVQSLVPTARRHFAAIETAQSESDPNLTPHPNLTEGIWDRLPTFNRKINLTDNPR